MEKKPQMLIIDPANELKFVGKWIEWKIVLKNDPTFSCQKSLWRLYERKSEEIARSGFLNLSIFSVNFGRFHNLSGEISETPRKFLGILLACCFLKRKLLLATYIFSDVFMRNCACRPWFFWSVSSTAIQAKQLIEAVSIYIENSTLSLAAKFPFHWFFFPKIVVKNLKIPWLLSHQCFGPRRRLLSLFSQPKHFFLFLYFAVFAKNFSADKKWGHFFIQWFHFLLRNGSSCAAASWKPPVKVHCRELIDLI